MTAKRLSQNQITGQRGEFLVADRTLAIGFVFDIRNRLETGIDGLLELRDPVSRETQARWIGVQVKTTESAAYAREDAAGFEYLLNPDDLAYWSRSNIPVIVVLVRLSDQTMFWKHVDGGGPEPRRLRFDKMEDRYEPAGADRIAALCVERDRLGSFVPPMLAGEPGHLTMLRLRLPDEIFVATSLFGSRRDAVQALVAADPAAPFDWVVRRDRFLSFQDPQQSALGEIIDPGKVEAVETEAVALMDDPDDEHLFIDLLRRTLSARLDRDLSWDKESRALFFRAHGEFRGRTIATAAWSMRPAPRSSGSGAAAAAAAAVYGIMRSCHGSCGWETTGTGGEPDLRLHPRRLPGALERRGSHRRQEEEARAGGCAAWPVRDVARFPGRGVAAR